MGPSSTRAVAAGRPSSVWLYMQCLALKKKVQMRGHLCGHQIHRTQAEKGLLIRAPVMLGGGLRHQRICSRTAHLQRSVPR